MKLSLPIKLSITTRSRPIVLGALIVALAGLAGASGLVYPAPYSPLLFLGGIVAIVTIIAWLAKPAWALYAAVFVVFLPLGLIPANIHSMLNRSLTVIAAGVWLVRVLSTRQKMVWTASALFMLVFLAWSGVTLLWAERTSLATNALQVYSLRFVMFLFLIPNEIRTKQDLNGLMKILAVIGWVLMLSVVKTLLLEGYTVGSRLKIFSENENGVGVLAMVTMVGVLWQASQPSKKHRTLRTLMAAVFILLTVGLVAMSGSRGSALTLIVTLSTFWLWKPLHPWGKLGFLIAILALILTPSLFTTLAERFAVERGDTALGGREALWQAAGNMIRDHPLDGVGIGNAPYVSVQYLETDPRMAGAQSAAIHNPLLTIGSETGIPGILFYLGVLISALYSFGKQYLKFRQLECVDIIPYFALVSCVTLGYMISWFKGGGMESAHSYFLILALLSLPVALHIESPETDHPT